MPPADPRHYVRGQYQGYAGIPGVARGSATETYVALRLEIGNWRWADVVQPLLDHPPDVRPYPRGSWGPTRRKPWSAATRAGSSRGCPRRDESVNRTS